MAVKHGGETIPTSLLHEALEIPVTGPWGGGGGIYGTSDFLPTHSSLLNALPPAARPIPAPRLCVGARSAPPSPRCPRVFYPPWGWVPRVPVPRGEGCSCGGGDAERRGKGAAVPTRGHRRLRKQKAPYRIPHGDPRWGLPTPGVWGGKELPAGRGPPSCSRPHSPPVSVSVPAAATDSRGRRRPRQRRRHRASPRMRAPPRGGPRGPSPAEPSRVQTTRAQPSPAEPSRVQPSPAEPSPGNLNWKKRGSNWWESPLPVTPGGPCGAGELERGGRHRERDIKSPQGGWGGKGTLEVELGHQPCPNWATQSRLPGWLLKISKDGEDVDGKVVVYSCDH